MRWSDAKTILRPAALFAQLALILTLQPALSAGDVDPSRLRAADTEPQNWFTLGRDQNQAYFSPLAQIDASNVGRLGFAWAYDLGTARGQEATPIVIDGTMYTSGTWGYVYALDAATGEDSGSSTLGPIRARPVILAATSSIVAWRSGKGRCSSPRSTAGSTPSMPRRARSSGTRIPSRTTNFPIPAPAPSTSPAMWRG